MIGRDVISIILILGVFQSASAASYVETDRYKQTVLRKNGVGAEYYYKGSDGAVAKYRINRIKLRPDGNIDVQISRADRKVHITFDDENSFTYESVKSESYGTNRFESNQQTSATQTGSLSTKTKTVPEERKGWTDGMGSAAIAGIQTGLILASGYIEQIEAAYRKVAELETQMGKDFKRLETARFDLKKGIATVAMTASEAGTESEILNLKSRQSFNHSPERLRFKSNDQDFLANAEQISSKLARATLRDPIDIAYADIAKRSLVEADQANLIGAKEDAEVYLHLADTAVDVLLGLNPLLGAARGLYEAVSGRNLITDEVLSPLERTLAVADVLMAGYASRTSKVFKAIDKLASQIAPALKKSLAPLHKFVKRTTVDSAPSIAVKRDIEWWSKKDPKWGFTARHINKHMVGDSVYSLKITDPGGNVEKWLGHIEELASSPHMKQTGENVFDIISQFPRADGTMEPIEIGIRLFKNNDGSFDFITLLTKQRRSAAESLR